MGLRNLEKLAESLPVINFVDNAKPHHFIRDGGLFISGEHGDYLIDYYGEVNNGDPYIHPDLVAWAEKQGGFWEWENSGCVQFNEN